MQKIIKPEQKYYVVLTGAKKNIGDYLITQRTKELLREVRKDRELVQIENWVNLEPYLDIINDSEAIIIMGGPGYQPNMYPGIYKLTKDLSQIKVPIIPLGLGWSGYPGDYYTLNNYKFNSDTKALLEKVNQNGFALSCRDYYTYEALKRNGFKNIKMTGCPVWYHIDSIGKEFAAPETIKKVVYTPAQEKEYRNQSIEVMKVIKKVFKNAEIYCSFHRGIGSKDEFTHDWEVENTDILADEAKKLGLIPVDTAFDLNRINFYDECDLHIGYRVHGHIYFLSKRKPSILLHEDGRGRGVSEALNIHGIDAFERTYLANVFKNTENHIVMKLVNKLTGVIKENNIAHIQLENFLEQELESGFNRYISVGNKIDSSFNDMVGFVKTLP